MDPDKLRDYEYQGPLPDMEEDYQILARLLKYIPYSNTLADIDKLIQEIPVHLPVVVPVGQCRKM
jgi:hypothetical protein